MIRYPNLIPECNVDTAFVEMLGYENPNHTPNIQQVCISLEKYKPDTVCIGFIDDDKKKPGYVNYFNPIEKSKYFRILKHENRNQYLVIANPAMDNAIFRLCEDVKIDISKYNLPNQFEAFLSKTKRLAIRTDKNFKTCSTR